LKLLAIERLLRVISPRLKAPTVGAMNKIWRTLYTETSNALGIV